MNFCSTCASPVVQRVPPDDDRLRHVCDSCGAIHYQNPKIIAGCIPVWEDKILLCQRAIEPRRGLWTVPAGFMENGETTAEGAARETHEEATAHVEIERLHCYLDIPRINQVYVIFIGRLLAPDYAPGTESLVTELRTEAQIPWGNLAFPSIAFALEKYYEDQRDGNVAVHMRSIDRSTWKPTRKG